MYRYSVAVRGDYDKGLTQYVIGDSPDRLDAMVYALTELMIENPEPGLIAYHRELVESDRVDPFGWSMQDNLKEPLVALRAPDGISHYMRNRPKHSA